MSHGRSDAVAGVARRVDSMSLLDNPQASVQSGPVGASSVPVGNQIINEYPTFPSDTIPVGFKTCFSGTCSCIFTGTVPKYVRGATDTFTVRAGPSTVLQMAAAMSFKQGNPDSNCLALQDKAVNIIRRSTNCGMSWTTSVLNAGGFDNKFFSNADMPFMYVDRNNTNRIFLAGGSGPPIAGVSGVVIWRSDDNGQTRVPKFTPKVAGDHMKFSTYAMTSTSADGTIVFAGCAESNSESNDAPLYVYYSVNHGEQWVGPVAQPASVSNCGFVRPDASAANSNSMPGRLMRVPGNFLSVSRVKPSSGANYSSVRIMYSARENDSQGVATSQRQVAKIVGVNVPKPGVSGVTAALSNLHTLRPSYPDDSIFLATYIETDAFGPAIESDAALLWWLEGGFDDFSSANYYSTYYRIQSSQRTFSPTYLLGTIPDLNGGQLFWEYNKICTPAGGCWLGEYERGAFWYEPSANKLHFWAAWPAKNLSISTALHSHYLFNEVQVTP